MSKGKSSLKSTSKAEPLKTKCINCNSIIDGKNIRRLGAQFQFMSSAKNGFETITYLNAISAIFLMKKGYEKKINEDSLLCSNCTILLGKLYKHFNEFTAMTIKAKSPLYKTIDFDKDNSSSSKINTSRKRRSSALPPPPPPTETNDNFVDNAFFDGNNNNDDDTDFEMGSNNSFELTEDINSKKKKAVTNKKSKNLVLDAENINFMQLEKNHLGEYQCTSCPKTFKYEVFLRQHLRTHVAKNVICNICRKAFLTKSDLKVHKLSHKANESLSKLSKEERKKIIHKCEICEKVCVSNFHLLQHQRSHKLRKFQCQFCKKRFFDKSVIEAHLLSSHPEKIKGKLKDKEGEDVDDDSNKITCNVCFKNFTNKHNLIQHQKTHLVKSISCKLCQSKLFATEKDYEQHLRQAPAHKSLTLMNSIIEIQKDTSDQSLLTQTDEPLFPEVQVNNVSSEDVNNDKNEKEFFMKSFELNPVIRNEEAAAEEDRNYTAPENDVNMQAHEGENATTSKSIANVPVTKKKRKEKCKECGETYDSPMTLKVHIENDHQKEFPCNICPYLFTSKIKLEKHLENHKKQIGPFFCKYEQCKKEFSSSRLRNKHQINVHNKKGQKQPIQQPKTDSDKNIKYTEQQQIQVPQENDNEMEDEEEEDECEDYSIGNLNSDRRQENIPIVQSGQQQLQHNNSGLEGIHLQQQQQQQQSVIFTPHLSQPTPQQNTPNYFIQQNPNHGPGEMNYYDGYINNFYVIHH